MKKINIIGTVGVPACYGGFESLVENILDYTPIDVEYTVFCTSQKYENKLETYKGAKLIYLDLNANGKDSIMYDYKSMKMSLDADIMLILGVSGCIFLPFIRKKFKGKIVTNIDGLEWKRDKWNPLAKWLLHTSEKLAVKYSDVVIGDNKGITDYVKEAYGKDAVLIAYGGDHATKITDDSLYEKYPYMKDPYSVTVCRIEPENNIHIILEAFSKMPDNQLVMVGNWKNSEYGVSLKQQYSNYDNIHLLGPIYESHEINWIRSNASLYVHGHSAGGTNPSLVEAMNLGLPIIAFDCVYNRATTHESCLYWKQNDDIVNILNSKKDSFKSISRDMKEIGLKEYSWKKIAEEYNNLWR
ncbi:MAG: DUF1972 domain-containing protein [Spirochaetia bacterium]|nr:DUF1972 domain-containing protein [Spirochaetia bacterium]